MQSIRYQVGAAIALVGVVLGIVGSLSLCIRWYDPVMVAEAAAG
ncbi:MAG: hypothetical protein ACP5JG_15680 [Anaerolineae bacterium]